MKHRLFFHFLLFKTVLKCALSRLKTQSPDLKSRLFLPFPSFFPRFFFASTFLLLYIYLLSASSCFYVFYYTFVAIFAPTHLHKHAHVPFVRFCCSYYRLFFFLCLFLVDFMHAYSFSLSLALYVSLFLSHSYARLFFLSLRAHTQDDNVSFLRLLYLTHVTIILITCNNIQ